MSKSLHRLIQSLSKSEKRYIKINLFFKQKETNLEIMYKSFLKEKVYNVSKINKNINNVNITKAYSTNCSDLYQNILNSLRNYSSKENVDMQLEEIQSNVQVLFNRRMYNEALNEITKGLNLAEKYARPINSLNFIYYEFTINYLINDREKNLMLNKHAINKVSILSKKLISELEYKEQYTKLFVLLAKKHKGQIENIQEELIPYKTLKLTKDTNLRAKLLFYNAKYYFHKLNNDDEIALKEYSKQLKLLEENEWCIKNDLVLYFVVVYNYVILLVESKEFENAYKKINELKNKISNSNKISTTTKELYNFKYALPLELIYAQKSLDYTYVLPKKATYFNEILINTTESNQFEVFQNYHNLLIISFISKDYEFASKICSQIKDIEKTYWNTKANYIYLLEYISYFELSNFKYLPFLKNQFSNENFANTSSKEFIIINLLMKKMKNPLFFNDAKYIEKTILYFSSLSNINYKFARKYNIIEWLKNRK